MSDVLSSERWRAASACLDEALDLPTDERDAWLASLRATNPGLADDVGALLNEHDAVLDRRFLEDHVTRLTDLPTDHPGSNFGRYRLVQRLGEGGMGTVWLAHQEQPIRRTVAVKVVKPGADSKHVLARFESERQALAILNHHHIAKVFDAGATDDGRPYFVMEYVSGLPLNAFADRQELTIVDRLRLLLQVCDAVQHAHQKGVLHRDLKPGNILVAEQDGQPVAKVIDFGIAKAIGPHLTGATLQTELGVLVGTPEYMSPEQAGLVEAAVDTRTDIYSLGLILYELLIGFPAFATRSLRRDSVLEVLRAIREDEPPRLTARLSSEDRSAVLDAASKRRTAPEALERQLRGDLEWITARAIEKDPARRYASVSELRGDIERHLHGEPVLAGPPSTLYRLRKLARRHRAAAVALVAIFLTVAVSAIVSTFSLVRALRAEDRTRRQLIGTLVAQGMQKVDAFDPLTGLVYLTRALELETDRDRMRSHRIRIGETLQRSPRLLNLWRHEAGITMLTLSPDGLVATGSSDGAIRIQDLSGGASRQLHQGAAIHGGELSRDGGLLAVASDDGTVKIWQTGDGRLAGQVSRQGHISDLALSPDGQLVAAIYEDGALRVWNVPEGSVRFEDAHQGQGRRVLFAHSGQLLASAATDGVRLWPVRSDQPAASVLRLSAGAVLDIAFTDDGGLLATASQDDMTRLWDARTGMQVGNPMRHDQYPGTVTFAGNSTMLVTTSVDGTTRVWRVPETTPVGPPRASASLPLMADVNRSLLIATATQVGLVELWSVGGARAAPSLPHGAPALIRFDRTGRLLVTADRDGVARVWDLAPGLAPPPRLAAEQADFHWRVVASPDRTSVATSGGGAAERTVVRVFDASTGAPVTPAMRSLHYTRALAFSPDGRRFVSANGLGELRLWDMTTSEPLTPVIREQIPWLAAAFSPSSDAFVVAGGREGQPSGAARIRLANDGSARTDFLPHDGPVIDASFSPDGRRLVTAAGGGSPNVKVWDTTTGRLLWAEGHPDGAAAARWSRDGLTILTGGFDQRVRSWNSSSGAPGVLNLKMLGGIFALDVTSDGARIVAGTSGGDVRLADLQHGSRLVSVMSHRGFVYEARFSPDGLMALSSSGDKTARLWDAKTGEPMTPGLSTGGAISRGATFLPDGRSWAWTGVGVYVDDVSVDERPPAEIRAAIESAAGRTLSESGTEIALSAEEIESRFVKSRGSGPVAFPPPPADYYRAEALTAWRRGAFEDVAAITETLRAQSSLNWLDVVRLLAAYASTNRWRDALDELGRHRTQWAAAPELIYMEAVALVRSGDREAAGRHCAASLQATRGTQHPERAYWAARACLLAPAIADDHRDETERRIAIAYEHMTGDLSRAELQGALLLRSGRPKEAVGVFRSALPASSTARHAVLQAALAAAYAGERPASLELLQRADAIRKPVAYFQIRPWLEAEADGLRDELMQALKR